MLTPSTFCLITFDRKLTQLGLFTMKTHYLLIYNELLFLMIGEPVFDSPIFRLNFIQ